MKIKCLGNMKVKLGTETWFKLVQLKRELVNWKTVLKHTPMFTIVKHKNHVDLETGE